MEQSDPNQVRLSEIDKAMLIPIVEKALDQRVLALNDWNYQQVHGGFGGGAGGTFIYRFKGSAKVQNGPTQWSIILKIIHARPDEAPDSIYYWKREAEAYRSGLLENLPGRVSAAKSYQIIEYPDEACWIWQEDIQDGIVETWTLEHYGHVARHFGQFNGAYLSTQPIPSRPWLASRWLRHIAETTEQFVPQIRAMLNDPLLQPAYPPDAENLFLTLWGERERFLSALDSLPQTFAHQDPVRRNLFLRRGSGGEYETVAIDWAYVGQAAVGMDIAVPFNINFAFMDLDISVAQEFEACLYSGYLDGLQDAGWNGDHRQVRLGFTAATTCKYVEGLMLMASLGLITDPAQHPQMEAAFGHPIHEFIEQGGELFRYIFRLADEARQIMDELGHL